MRVWQTRLDGQCPGRAAPIDAKCECVRGQSQEGVCANRRVSVLQTAHSNTPMRSVAVQVCNSAAALAGGELVCARQAPRSEGRVKCSPSSDQATQSRLHQEAGTGLGGHDRPCSENVTLPTMRGPARTAPALKRAGRVSRNTLSQLLWSRSPVSCQVGSCGGADQSGGMYAANHGKRAARPGLGRVSHRCSRAPRPVSNRPVPAGRRASLTQISAPPLTAAHRLPAPAPHASREARVHGGARL